VSSIPISPGCQGCLENENGNFLSSALIIRLALDNDKDLVRDGSIYFYFITKKRWDGPLYMVFMNIQKGYHLTCLASFVFCIELLYDLSKWLC
ncbi:hypothetical protein ACJX0J_036922, partial [Zea mays]